ncbi:SRPBCC family protein [Chlorobium sp. BLA1]|uniref:SRPBCC family protein n=1 Tax=Candidatus Chlorobium masyuteum TaxID=2716876 RepID=UPI0014241763|nr:SRPBCC family protein [Candidatus Chlorobium masyuteum]NHQ59978.1 SRPBCC family protein [Candidatus Chlorobium masyuteum]
MSFSVEINIERAFETPATTDKVFALLADVPRSASHFPKVDRFIDLGSNTFRWEMEKIGIGSYTLQQTIYACCYSADAVSRKIVWTSVAGVGNAKVEGEWAIRQKEDGTAIVLKTKGELMVDFPSFLQIIISPLVVMEFTSLIDQYLANLQKSFTVL